MLFSILSIDDYSLFSTTSCGKSGKETFPNMSRCIMSKMSNSLYEVSIESILKSFCIQQKIFSLSAFYTFLK